MLAWLLSLFTGWSVWSYIKWSVIGVVVLGVTVFAVTYASKLSGLAKQNIALRIEVSDLKHTITKYDGRLASYKRMIDRRDAAINSLPTAYKNKMKRYISHPDEVPGSDKIFTDPLSVHTEGQPNAVDTDPVPPFEWPSISLPSLPKLPDVGKLMPWNW